ncbi:MAG: hypothetical protein IJ447_05755 [Clostridia bacterium]|nr:hypothetical protein [Clostridia bacterium]
MNYNFDDYLNVVKLNIKNKKLHAPICTELESHLQDSADFYVEIGYDEVTAKYKALEDMGPPHYVAENLAKLHKLSTGQVIAEVIYTVFMVAVIGFSVIGFLGSFVITWDYNNSDDLLLSLAPVLVGFIMSVRHKRVLPARLAIILAVADFGTLIGFWNITLVRVFGLWVESRTIMEIDMYGKYQNVFVLILSVVLTVAVTGLLIFTYDKISTYVSTPNVASVNFKRIFDLVAIPLLCVVVAGTAVNEAYVRQSDIEEKEKWSKVVAEFCDYCLENEKITVNDIDDVLAHFDYLEFKEYNHTDDPSCTRHLSAVIGEKSEAFPHFCICVMEDGSIEIEVVAYILNSVWEQEDKGYTFGSNPLARLDQGDDVTKYTEIIKNENLMLFYKYDAETDEVRYKTLFAYGDGYFDNFTHHIAVDSGKITSIYYDD